MTHSMPAHALPGSVRTHRRPLRRRRRSAWRWRIAPAIAACALGVEAVGQQNFDVRPIYYAMLEAVESSLGAHSERIQEAYRASREAFDERAARDLRRLEAEGEEIERLRRNGDAAFEAERAELNARIKVLNEAVARLETDIEGTAAAIESYRQAYERVLVELRTAQSLYRELSAQVRTRGEALEAATGAYRDGTSEDARQIARLDDAYRRLAAQVRDAFGEREAALRQEEVSLRTWLHAELEGLEGAGRVLASTAEQYATLEEDHDRVQGELNRRIAVYNERVRAASDDTGHQNELAALRDEIAEFRESLEAHRERATIPALGFLNRRAALEAEYATFEKKRSERMAALRLRAEALLAEQRDVDALMESRHTDVQAQIEIIESRIHAHLASLREDVDEAEQRLQEEFGSLPGALFAATSEWTRSLDSAHLYDSTGTPSFDRLPLRSSAIYEAVDAVSGLEIEARSKLGEHLAEVQRQRAEIARERQNLIERQSAFAAEHAERHDHWNARLETANEESRRLREARDTYFEGKLALVGFEFQALQGAVLDVLGTPAATRLEIAEQHRLIESVSEAAAELSDTLEPADTSARSLVDGFAAMGRNRGPEAPAFEWEYVSAESFSGDGALDEHTLDGASKHRLLAAWYRRLDSAGTFDSLAHGLSEHFPSHSAANLEDALQGLFEAGMDGAGNAVRYQRKGGKSAYQIRILDRSYWVQPDGSLLLTPLTW